MRTGVEHRRVHRTKVTTRLGSEKSVDTCKPQKTGRAVFVVECLRESEKNNVRAFSFVRPRSRLFRKTQTATVCTKATRKLGRAGPEWFPKTDYPTERASRVLHFNENELNSNLVYVFTGQLFSTYFSVFSNDYFPFLSLERYGSPRDAIAPYTRLFGNQIFGRLLA